MVKPVNTETDFAAGQTVASKDPSTQDLSRQVDALKSDISRLTETLGEYGRAKGKYYRTEAERRANDLRDEAQSRVDDIESYVRQNPAQALGIAAGIGLLIGLIGRR